MVDIQLTSIIGSRNFLDPAMSFDDILPRPPITPFTVEGTPCELAKIGV